MAPVRIGIIGANGYSGEELCTLLTRHPHADVVCITSRQHAGKTVKEILPRLAGRGSLSELRFVEPSTEALLAAKIDLAFLALPHGLAAKYAIPLLEKEIKIIDISADFRLRNAETYFEFYGENHPAPHFLKKAVYGLPEVHSEKIRTAQLVACPGCYPTSILLPLLPLLSHKLLRLDSLCVSSTSGLSGAGRKPEVSLLFGECNESVRSYSVPKHRHLSEIEQELSWAAEEPVRITFVPHLAPANRGIHTTIFATPTQKGSLIAAHHAWEKAYAHKPFIRCSECLPDTKNVTMTNFCDLTLRVDDRTGKWILLSAIDNLLKGASGQAIQCFNLMCNFAESEGLLP